MTGFEELASVDIFKGLNGLNGSVSVSFFEIAGKSLNDLFGEEG